MDLQPRLTSSDLTSVDLVHTFLDHIELFNLRGPKFKAVISVDDVREKVVARANLLDKERRRGKLRSKLHGIRIIIKVVYHFSRVRLGGAWLLKYTQDAIVTAPSLGMPTTVGSHVFLRLKAKKNATVVNKVLFLRLRFLPFANIV